jgi:class 3 adenylate cyclase
MQSGWTGGLPGRPADEDGGRRVETIRAWLERHGLGQYTTAFESNDVDLEVLPSLTEDDLQALGVSLGHRKKILKAVLEAPGARGLAIDPGGAPPPIETVTAAGERRQVTVLFCDLVDSVAMSVRLDPEEFRSTMAAYHAAAVKAIQRFDGFPAQIQGDGVVAYFGYPLAHEAEADRAIRAALTVVDAVQGLRTPGGEPLQVRVGIATGLVVVSHILAAEKSAVGETPNLAHRLQSIAQPGEILVSGRTKGLAGGAFDFEDCGLHALKGIEGRVQAWKVIGVGAAASRFEAATRGGMTPLVGREQEIGLLLDRWQLARSGAGQVVLLMGEPGIGKSRTMRALRSRLGDAVSTVLQYQCSPYHENSALYPVIDHLERAFGFAAEDSPEARLDKLEHRVTEAWGGGRYQCQLLARLLSLPADARYGPLAMTPQRQKDETLRVLVDMVAAIAEREPALIFFEDLHWADPTTIEILDLMVARTGTLPLLVLASFRPEFETAWTRQAHVTLLPLTRLSPLQSRHLVLELTAGKPLPDELVSQIIDKTDGVPLFLEELTKAVLESGMVVDAGSRYVYAQSVDRMTVPATLRDSLMARLDRLIPVKEIAQIGAVVGREFSHELVAAVSPMRGAPLDDALDRLVASGLVFQRGTRPEAVYTFKHALVQDAAYDSLLKAKRQELHARIAEAIGRISPGRLASEPELLAHHYTAAGMLATAVPLWRKAGELTLERMALTEAVAHLERGLEVNAGLPPSPERDAAELSLRALLGTAWMALRGWPAQQVAEALGPALPLARGLSRPEIMMPVMWGLWSHVLVQGRIAESLAIAQEMLDDAARTRHEDLLIGGHICAMVSRFWLGHLVAAREHGDAILAIYRGEEHRHVAMLTNSDPKTIMGLYGSHWLWMLGYPEQAVRLSDEKDAHARRIGHPFDLGFALTTGSHAFDYRCEPEALFQRVAEAEKLGRDNSVPFISEVMAQVVRGVAMLRAGDPAGAIPQLRHGIGMWSGHGANIWNPYLKALVGEALALTGDLESACRTLDECIAQANRPGWEERAHLAEILRLKGWVLERSGDTGGAERSVREGLAVARSQQAKSWELRCATTLAELLAARGDHDEARRTLAPVYAWFTEGLDTRDLVKARALLERLD